MNGIILTIEPGPIERVKETSERIERIMKEMNWKEVEKRKEKGLEDKGIGSSAMEI